MINVVNLYYNTYNVVSINVFYIFDELYKGIPIET
jgi:hypothetical protein